MYSILVILVPSAWLEIITIVFNQGLQTRNNIDAVITFANLNPSFLEENPTIFTFI